MERNKKLQDRFSRFSQEGITALDVQAAAKVLRRELGRLANIDEIGDYIERFILWRHYERKWKNGEITIKYEYTKAGKAVKAIESFVNNIFGKGGTDA